MKLVAPSGKRSRRRSRWAVKQVRGRVEGQREADARGKVGRFVAARMRWRQVEVGVELAIDGQAMPAPVALKEIPARRTAGTGAPVQLGDRRSAHIQRVGVG